MESEEREPMTSEQYDEVAWDIVIELGRLADSPPPSDVKILEVAKRLAEQAAQLRADYNSEGAGHT